MKRCKCGAELEMVKTTNGRWTPAEAEVFTFVDFEGKTRKGRIVHWGRCPKEDSYRKPKVKKPELKGEVCLCGHARVEHDDRGCLSTGCDCDRFYPIPQGPDEGQEGGP